ncbi:hypothetical protein VNO77_19643 [Canavalia gladiata]|uniref:Uncharacterized protein n=1 Tax=Canavalia gladiata TaxID=3824 RepID=A0AAN9QLM2_CANGL
MDAGGGVPKKREGPGLRLLPFGANSSGKGRRSKEGGGNERRGNSAKPPLRFIFGKDKTRLKLLPLGYNPCEGFHGKLDEGKEASLASRLSVSPFKVSHLSSQSMNQENAGPMLVDIYRACPDSMQRFSRYWPLLAARVPGPISGFWATWARGKGWARPICASLQVQAYLGLITKSVSQHSTMQGVSTWEDPMQKERQNQAITGPTSEHV